MGQASSWIHALPNSRKFVAGLMGAWFQSAAVLSLDELDGEASILLIRVAIPWYRWAIEVIERHEEPHRGPVGRNQVLQHEEFDIPFEVAEQREKVAVPE